MRKGHCRRGACRRWLLVLPGPTILVNTATKSRDFASHGESIPAKTEERVRQLSEPQSEGPSTIRKPRVLMLATRVPKSPGDGTPSFVLDGAIALSDRFDITILAPRMHGTSRRTKHGSVTVERFPYFPNGRERLANDAIVPQLQRDRRLWLQAVALTLSMLAHAWRAHRGLAPAIVHAHWIVPSGLVARILKSFRGAPYILTSHGADAFVNSQGVVGRAKRIAVAGAARFVAVSQEISDRYEDVSSRHMVQPVGVDFAAWKLVRQTRDPEDGRVLFVGRLTEKKGVDTLLLAAHLAPSISIHIVGDGPELERLHAMADEFGVLKRTHFYGRLTRQELEQQLRIAAIMAIPSVVARNGDRDGTPTVLAEAIAAGVPVVCSRLAGLASLVEDGISGLTVTPGDAEELAAALRRLTENPALGQSLADAALEGLRQQLDSRLIADRYAAWYREAAESRT